MRTAALILGIVLLLAGGLISAGLIEYETQETVAKLGPLEMTTTQQRQPAPLLGYLLLGGGVLALVVGLTRRK